MCDDTKLITVLTEDLDGYINKYPGYNKNPPCYEKLFELYERIELMNSVNF